jgi:uncharacterized protein YjiS (DUF1127 family)
MRFSNPTAFVIDVQGWYQAAAERRELLAMDDRMLRDIGISRADAEQIAEHGYHPEEPALAKTAPVRPDQVDRAVVDAAIARAHRMRNEAIGQAFAGLWRSLWPQPQPNARIRKLAPVAR